MSGTFRLRLRERLPGDACFGSGSGRYNGSAIYFKGTEWYNRLLIVVLGENSLTCSSHIEAGMISIATPSANLLMDGSRGNGTQTLNGFCVHVSPLHR